MSRRAERLRALDQLGPPDLWPDIRERVPRPSQERQVASFGPRKVGFPTC